MSGAKKNNHWVSRFLTRPWEDEKRYLHFVSLRAKTVQKRPSKKLLAKVGLHTSTTEDVLDKYVENVVGAYLDAAKKAGHLDEKLDAKGFRALLGLLTLQFQRSHEALLPESPLMATLDDLLKDPERYLSQSAAYWLRTHALMGLNCPGELFFFPSVGYFVLPMHGGIGWAMPLSPTWLAALIPKGEPAADLLRGLHGTVGVLSALALAGGGINNSWLIPQDVLHRLGPEHVVKWFLEQRNAGRKLFNCLGAMAHTAGLRAMTYDHEQDD